MNRIRLSKKNWVGIGIALLLAGAAILYRTLRTYDAWHALPAQTALVVEMNGFELAARLCAKTPDTIWQTVFQSALFLRGRQDAALTAALFAGDEAFSRIFRENRLLAAYSVNPADSLHPLLALQVDRDFDLEAMLDARQDQGVRVFSSHYRGRVIYTVYKNEREKIVLTQARNLLLFSRYSFLVEDALTQLRAPAVWKENLQYERPGMQKAALKIWLRPEALAVQISGKMTERRRNLPELLQKNVRWVGVAWNGAQSAGLLHAEGILHSLDMDAATPRGEIFTILPDNTAALIWMGFSDAQSFFRKIAPAGQSADFKKYVLPWAGKEAAWALTEPFSPDLQNEQFLIVEAADTAAALQSLRDFGAKRGMMRRYDYQTYEVMQFLSASLLSPVTASENSVFRNPVCAIVGKYAVFAPSSKAMEIWIDKYVVSQTLAGNTDFLQFNSRLPESGSVFWMLNTTYLPLICKYVMEPGAYAANAGDIAKYAQMGFTGFDLQALDKDRRQALTEAQPVRTAGSPEQETSILWKTPLAAPAATAPFIVPIENGEANIFIQDEQNALYCFNLNGTLKWKRSFSARILSDVKGLRFDETQATNFLFNTADRIWLLDANGKDVEGFPLSLQSPAVNGLIAADFDNNRKYCFFLCCANGNLYGFDQFGRPLPGWNPLEQVGAVRHPVLHFQKKDKDYLCVLNGEGVLRVFGRNGERRFPDLRLSGGRSYGPPQADRFAAAPRIAFADERGRVLVCDLNGAARTAQMGFPKVKSPARLVLAQGPDNTKGALALLQGAQLRLNGKTNILYAEQDTLFQTGSDLGLLNRDKKQISLLLENGQIHPDFPLAGTTPFASGFFSQRKILVVGNGAGIYSYAVRQ